MIKKILYILVIIVLLSFILGYCGAVRTPAQRVPTYNGPVQGRIFHLAGDGKTDDTEALNAWGRGEIVLYKGKLLANTLQNGKFIITWKVKFNKPHSIVRNNTFIIRYEGFDSLDIIDYSKRVKYRHNKLTDESTYNETKHRRKR